MTISEAHLYSIRSKAPGSRACGLAALVVLIASASHAADLAKLVDRVSARDRDGKHTAPAPDVMEEVYGEILKGGPRAASANVKALVRMLVAPGEGEDYKARYVLHALVTHVTRPGMEDDREAVTDGLISSLGAAPAANVKAFVIGELQFLHDRKAIAPLAKFLAEDDTALADAAARALVDIGSEAVPELAKALRTARGRTRLSVIQALGDLGDSRSVKPFVNAIVPLLHDPERDTRVAAAVALSKIADARAAGPLLRALDGTRGYETIQVADACFVLADNLIKSGKKSGQTGQRRGTDEAFRIFRHMWKSLGDRNEPQIRHAVVEGLATGFSSEPTYKLVPRLKSGDPATRAAVLHVLGLRGDPVAFRAVAAATKDGDRWVALKAFSALGPVGRERSVPLLVAALPGDGPEAAQVLRTALLKVPGEGSGRAIADGLARVADGPDASAVRMVLLDVLAGRGAAETADAAFLLVMGPRAEKDAPVRVAALKALARSADGSFAERLAPLLPQVRHAEELKALEDALAETCIRIPDGKARLEPLLQLLAGGGVPTRCAVLRVVGRVGTAQSVSMLLDAMEDGDAEVRDAAVKSLSEFPNDKPAAELLRIARTADSLKHQVLALRGYVKMAEKKKDKEKVAMLRDAISLAKRPDEKKLVLGQLGRIRTVDALKAVVPHLDDPNVTREACRAAWEVAKRLGNKDRDVVIPAMEKVVASTADQRLKRDATNLIKKMKGGK